MTDQPAVSVHPATATRWDDVAAVMGVRGDPAHCWCQFFRLRGKDWESATRSANRAQLRRQVQHAADPPGVVAYVDDEPVGWCAVAPKSSYPRVVASRTTGAELDGVWSITCFVVRVGWRRRGIAAALLGGAVELARSAGARTVEGYPVDPAARSSVSAAELYHGPVGLFVAAGFTVVQRPSPARALVTLSL